VGVWGRDRIEFRQPRRAIGEPPIATQPVERAMLGHLYQSGGRVGRDTIKRPGLKRLDERILSDLLGEREVAGSLTFASWNRITAWLRTVDELRRAG